MSKLTEAGLTPEIVDAMDRGDAAAVFGTTTVFGALVPYMGKSFTLVALHGPAGSRRAGVHLDRVDIAPGVVDLLTDRPYAQYADAVANKPALSSVGTFLLGEGNRIVDAQDLETISANDLSVAIRGRLDHAIAIIDHKGLKPKYSADELMEIMRGDDYDGMDDEGAAAPSP